MKASAQDTRRTNSIKVIIDARRLCSSLPAAALHRPWTSMFLVALSLSCPKLRGSNIEAYHFLNKSRPKL